MDLGLAGKRALVTGASRGIGLACARALSAEGVRVALCARGEADLIKALEGIGGRDAGHDCAAIDLTDAAGPQRALDWLDIARNPIDIVVHNLGGTLGVRDPLAPAAAWRDVWRMNIEVAVELNAALLPPMIERKSGRMVFVSSLTAFESHGALAHAVAKSALTAYVRGLGREYAKDRVVISAVVPGVIMSEGGHWENNLRNDPAYVEQYIRERLPRGEFGTPDEVAAAVTFLCSKHATPFMGSIVPLEGGQGRSYFGQ
jgi:NAD(P)-dependent dehydrogenase (short-subunit alcohol dehydrogenase family)